MFRHTVPNLKVCSHSINRARAHYCEIVGTALGNQRKTCSHKEPLLSLVPECGVSTLYSGTGIEPEFWRWVIRKRCVHIGAQLRIVSWHCARAPIVNTALNVLVCFHLAFCAFLNFILKQVLFFCSVVFIISACASPFLGFMVDKVGKNVLWG